MPVAVLINHGSMTGKHQGQRLVRLTLDGKDLINLHHLFEVLFIPIGHWVLGRGFVHHDVFLIGAENRQAKGRRPVVTRHDPW